MRRIVATLLLVVSVACIKLAMRVHADHAAQTVTEGVAKGLAVAEATKMRESQGRRHADA